MNNVKYILEYAKNQITKIVDKLGKDKTLMIVGAIIFVLGFMMYQSRPKVLYQETGAIEEEALNEDSAKSIITSILPNILKVYESPGDLFTIGGGPSSKEEEVTSPEDKKDDKKKKEDKEEVNGAIIEDYESVMTKYFTKDGINEFEQMLFGDKTYYKKVDKTVYFVNDVIPDQNKFSKDTYILSKPIIKDNEIECTINFSRLNINQLDEVNYEVYTKKLVLVKDEQEEDNKKEKTTIWLVDSFNYANKM